MPKCIYLAVIYNTTSLPLRTVRVLYNQKSPRWERFWVIDAGELYGSEGEDNHGTIRRFPYSYRKLLNGLALWYASTKDFDGLFPFPKG